MKLYKREVILLLLALSISFSCHAEGQAGMYEVLLIAYVFSFAFYISFGSIIIYQVRRILGYEKSKSWKYISLAIAVLWTLLLFLFTDGIDFIPLSWFLN